MSTQESAKKPSFNVKIGDVKLWYPGADRNRQPRPAIVTGPWPLNGDGMLNLAILPDRRGDIQPEEDVRHVDDPYREGRPRLQDFDGPGGWDDLPTDDVETAIEKVLAKHGLITVRKPKADKTNA